MDTTVAVSMVTVVTAVRRTSMSVEVTYVTMEEHVWYVITRMCNRLRNFKKELWQ